MLIASLAGLLLAAAPNGAQVVVVPMVRPEAISAPRALELSQKISGALAALGFSVPHEPAAALERLATLGCSGPDDHPCVTRLAAALGGVTVVVIDAGEVQGSVAVQIEAVSSLTARVIADASFLIQANDAGDKLGVQLGEFAATLKGALAKAAAAPSTGSGQAPSTGSGQAPSTGSGQAPDSAGRAEPPTATAPPAPEPAARPAATGVLLSLRLDGDVIRSGLGPGVSAGYSFGTLAADATLLLPKTTLGARLELRVFPFDFARLRPFVGAGATVFFARGWGSADAPGTPAPFAFGLRGAAGAELPLGRFHLRADLAVEGFLIRNRPDDYRPVALLLGIAGGVRL